MSLSLRLFVAISGLVGIAACAPTDVQSGSLDAGIVAELSARAVTQACGMNCDLLTVYVRDQLLFADTLVGEEEPMPPATREAITGMFDQVRFVDMGEADLLVGDDLRVDGGSGVLISVSPLVELGDQVVGIDVGLMTSGDGFHGQTIQFMWDGETWMVATSEDTGVTVTSAVS